MSGFGVFAKMNKKLEEGWKLTDADCPICRTTIIGNPKTKEMYCVSCEMPVKTRPAEEEDTEVEVVENSEKPTKDNDEYDNMVLRRQNDPNRKKNDDMSKKTGELLLQGWTMLGDTCFDCLFPLMRSRQGETVCVGCGPVDQKKEQVAEEAHKEDKSHSSTEIITHSEPKKQYTEVEVVEHNEKPIQGYDDYDNMVLRRENDPSRKKNNDMSKKTGELLLQGWTMLGDTCFDCLFPLMRSRQGETVCVGCGPVDQKKEQIAEPKKQEKTPLKKVDDFVPAPKQREPEQPRQVERVSQPAKKSSEDFVHVKREIRDVGHAFELGRCEESIDFYTRITQLLKADIEKLGANGILSKLDQVKKAIEIQEMVDEAKFKILRSLE